jgi:uncharacterized membrane protein
MDGVVAWLFKYPPVLFEQGHLRWGAPWLIPAAVLAGGLLVVALAYGRARVRRGGAGRWPLAALRVGVVVLFAWVVGRPMLVVSTVIPQENALAILVDDSRSMQIADQDGHARAEVALQLLADSGPLMPRLRRAFQVRLYALAGGARSIRGPHELTFGALQTRIGEALDRVREDVAGVPLAGVVLITDGADQAPPALNDALFKAKAARLPVYVIGVGQELWPRDLELSRLDVPSRALAGSTVMADVLVTHAGFDNAAIPVFVEEEGRVVAADTVRLGRRSPTPVRVPFPLGGAGLRHVRVRLALQAGEQLADNNEREALLYADDRRQKVLYVEGEPRFEAAFLRRAVASDRQLQVVLLQRTAENKFLRLGVDDPQELAAGFPKRREELFRYRAVVLGSVEASQFTHDQLAALRDFVGQRGGAVLMLGGRSAFAEGGYAGTPLEDLIPFALDAGPRPGGGDSAAAVEVQVTATPAGRAHPALQLAPGTKASQERWGSLPRLTVVNRIGAAKPGATVLLIGRTRRGAGRDIPILLFQRYGAGKVVAFTVQDSWLWQMHADMPVEDLTYETLWRQLLRWLVNGVPDPVTVTVAPDQVEPGDSVLVTAQVSDSAFAGINDAAVRARIVPPAGPEREIALTWSLVRDGEYRSQLLADLPGHYDVRVEARRGGAVLGSGETSFEATDTGAEFFGAQLRRALLERIAAETGGRFVRPPGAATLAEAVRFTDAGSTVSEEHDLWDVPAVFVVLLGLLAGEWIWRRARGLA